MKKILLLTLSIFIVVIAFAANPRPQVAVTKKGGKWNRRLECITYRKTEQVFDEDTHALISVVCIGKGNNPCPDESLDETINLGYVESAIQENLEYYNMTTGTIQYDDVIIYYKDASFVYDEPEDYYSKDILEIKGVEYSMTVMFKK
ncbi:MAG: hypothetical protein IKJ56_11240 [Bacteroidales bacterium]|nr:hypothetical protein [Bacteroidales bacterium]